MTKKVFIALEDGYFLNSSSLVYKKGKHYPVINELDNLVSIIDEEGDEHWFDEVPDDPSYKVVTEESSKVDEGSLCKFEVPEDRSLFDELKEGLEECVEIKEDLEGEWTDKHYDLNYQLTEEDVENGHIRIDAYFVNRMWKINSWDDTGAAFHNLKTFTRMGNEKNSLGRELEALYKQTKRLCKLHGVEVE